MQKKSGHKDKIAKGNHGRAIDSSGTRADAPEPRVDALVNLHVDPWQTALCKLPVTLAYAAVVDVRDAECEITDQMVTQACQDIEIMQQFPFAPKNSALSK